MLPSKRISVQASRYSVRQLLLVFGFTIPRRRRTRSFFTEYEGELEWIYHDCRKRYLELAKSCHPDNGGNHEDSVALNTSWDRLTHLFSLHCRSIKSNYTKKTIIPATKQPWVFTEKRRIAWQNTIRKITPNKREASRRNIAIANRRWAEQKSNNTKEVR